MAEAGYNPSQQLYATCTDIDPMVADMAFIQLALLVLISLDVYRYLHDPANVLDGGTLESDRIESERTEGRAGL